MITIPQFFKLHPWDLLLNPGGHVRTLVILCEIILRITFCVWNEGHQRSNPNIFPRGNFIQLLALSLHFKQKPHFWPTIVLGQGTVQHYVHYPDQRRHTGSDISRVIAAMVKLLTHLLAVNSHRMLLSELQWIFMHVVGWKVKQTEQVKPFVRSNGGKLLRLSARIYFKFASVLTSVVHSGICLLLNHKGSFFTWP